MMQTLVLVVSLMVSGAQSEVVAETDAGFVVVSDVERELEFMPGRERRYRNETGISSEQTRRDVIERLALRVIAVEQASKDGLDRDPGIIERVRQAQRLWLTGVWRKKQWGLDQSRLPSEATVRRKLEGTVPAPPDRIRLSHIYLPAPTDEDREQARQLMEQWRAESRDLETFRLLAQANSASQDRDRGGSMGWLHRGFLDVGIEETLFAMVSGSVSPPMYFDQGMHLFFVEKVEVDRAPRVDAQVRAETNRRVRELMESRRVELLGLARKNLEVRVKPNDACDWPDLQVGPYEVSGSVLGQCAGSTADVDHEVQVWIEYELLFQSALVSDWMTPGLRVHLNDISAQMLHDTAAARWATKNVSEPSQEMVKDLIEAEPQRFRYRLRLNLRAAAIPLDGETSPRFLARQLGEAADAMNDGRLTWEAAAKTFPPGTEVTEFPLATDLELAGALGPRVFKGIAKAKAGAVREPIQSEGQLWLVQVINRLEPGPVEDREAKTKARKILMSRQVTRLGREFGDRRLIEHHYSLTESGLRMTGEIPAPPKENQ